MKNFGYHKHGWDISWFDLKNLPEDAYLKKYNQFYQENPKSYFRKIFTILWKGYGLEIDHLWDHSDIIWQTPKNLYWIIFRDSLSPDKKGKWCFRVMKNPNDGTCCG